MSFVKGQTPPLFPVTVFALSALAFHVPEITKRKCGERWRCDKQGGGTVPARGWGGQGSVGWGYELLLPKLQDGM